MYEYIKKNGYSTHMHTYFKRSYYYNVDAVFVFLFDVYDMYIHNHVVFYHKRDLASCFANCQEICF